MIQYTTIIDSKCCGGVATNFDIPIGSTPHEIATITGMQLDRAYELWETRIAENPILCPLVYVSSEIVQDVQKNNCQFGVGSSVTVTVPAGMFSSQLSQQDAEDKANAYFEEIAQSLANSQGECVIQDCVDCGEYRVTRTKDCGEYRINTECRNGACTDVSHEYFSCSGLCNGETCIEECVECSSTCPTGYCPEGFNCDCGICKPDCENKACSSVCQQGVCPECETCVKGVCTPIKCNDGYECVLGECVPIDCGECPDVLVTETECTETYSKQRCRGDICVKDERFANYTVDKTNGLSCEQGECLNGSCVQNCTDTVDCNKLPCCSGVCSTPEGLSVGRCIEQCPQGFEEINGNCTKVNLCDGDLDANGSNTDYLQTYTIDFDGVISFGFEAYSQKDRMVIFVNNVIQFDTGCIAGAQCGTVAVATGDTLTVQVLINCESAGGTAWNIEVNCNQSCQ